MTPTPDTLRAAHFNELTPAEAERLACLAEELAEVVQIVGKILRHGYESVDPTTTNSPTNRHMLMKELGDVCAVVKLMAHAGDVDSGRIDARVVRKLGKLTRYNHHNSKELEAALSRETICGVKGELYPCKPDIFAATYEPAEAERIGS